MALHCRCGQESLLPVACLAAGRHNLGGFPSGSTDAGSVKSFASWNLCSHAMEGSNKSSGYASAWWPSSEFFLPTYASEFALQNKLEVSRHASSKHILPVTLLWSPHHFKARSKRSNTAVRKPYIVHERRILMLDIISEISFFFLGSISALVFQAGKLRILYVAPERLHNETLLESLKSQLPLPLLVVDGKICVSRKDQAKEVQDFCFNSVLRPLSHAVSLSDKLVLQRHTVWRNGGTISGENMHLASCI